MACELKTVMYEIHLLKNGCTLTEKVKCQRRNPKIPAERGLWKSKTKVIRTKTAPLRSWCPLQWYLTVLQTNTRQATVIAQSGLVHLWCTRTKIHPLKVCPVCGIGSPNGLVRCAYFLKFCTVHQPEKVGTVSPLPDTGTTRVTLVKALCCQLSYIPYVLKHCDLLVRKIIILWEAVCITVYS